MKKFTWKDITEVVGLMGVVAGLFFVGIEVRQGSSMGKSDGLNAATQNIAYVKELISSHSEVWVRGCRGEELTDGEKAVFSHLVRLYSLWAIYGYLKLQTSVVDVNMQYTLNSYAANIHRFPGFAAMVEEHNEWSVNILEPKDQSQGTEEFFRLLDERLNYLKEVESDPDFDVAHCGM